MLFSNIDYLCPDGTIQNGYVATKSGKFAYVGERRPTGDYGEEYEGRERLMIPGFVNAHCHVPMTLLRGYGEGLALDRWLNERIFPFEAQLDGEAVYWGSMLGIAEMIRAGITSFSEMYDHCADIGRAVLDTGVRCNLSRGVLCFDDTPLDRLSAYRETMELYHTLHGAGDGRLLVDFCIHGEYTSNPAIVEGMANAAARCGVRMQVHLSETQKEHRECVARRGMTPAAYFERLGVFHNPTTAAHCVWTTEEDQELLRRNGAAVAHCPTSNCKLGSGIAPVKEMLGRGLTVALGTDGVSSNNNFDMIKELRSAILLQNGRHCDPAALTPQQALQMATRSGAMAQGRDAGVIREGADADLAVLRCDMPNMTPRHDLTANLVYSAGNENIALTMCAGRVLYRDGSFLTLDIERTMAEARRAVDRVLGRLKC